MAKNMTLQEAQEASKDGVAILRDSKTGFAAKRGWAWSAGNALPYRTIFHQTLGLMGKGKSRWRGKSKAFRGDTRTEITARKKAPNLRKLGGWIPAKPMSPLEWLAAQAED